MNHSDETIEGFVVRCYSDEFSRGNYAGIIGDVCDSIEDVADAIVEYLEEQGVNDEDGSALSTEILASVRETIIEEAEPPVWEFEPRSFEEFAETNAPASIKVEKVRLSRRLVEYIRNIKPSASMP